MTFTKKKLAAAIGGTLLASVGVQQAQAVVDIDNTAGATALNYASEIVIGTSGVGLSHANALDVAGLIAVNGVQAATDIRVTLTLSGGTFTAPPTFQIVAADGAANTGCKTAANNTAATTAGDNSACAATTLFSGGTTADSTVTFNTSTGTGVVIAGAHALFTINGVTVPDQSAVTATVTTVIADSFGPTSLPDNSAAYFAFTPYLSLVSDAGSAEAVFIDVAQNSLFFSGAAGDDEINVGGARVAESALGQLIAASTAITMPIILNSNQHTITAAGGFAAFNQGTAGGSVELNNGGGANIAAVVSTSDATLAVAPSADATTAKNAVAFNDVILTIPSANAVTIGESTLTDTVTSVTAAALYSSATSSGTIALGSLTRNGSAARLTFSVNPTSSYPMSIRVTNDSAVVGPTTLTLTNDDGATSAAIDITTIAGGPAANLAAGASTALLSMADVFAAVQAADATFDLGTSSNKLRVNVTSLTPTIVLNAFSLSSDGTTFSMVTDAGA
jgi:hypothetical protein